MSVTGACTEEDRGREDVNELHEEREFSRRGRVDLSCMKFAPSGQVRKVMIREAGRKVTKGFEPDKPELLYQLSYV